MLILQASDMHAWDRSLFLWINLDAQSPAALVSLAVVASRWLLKDRRPPMSPSDDPRRYSLEMLVEPGRGVSFAYGGIAFQGRRISRCCTLNNIRKRIAGHPIEPPGVAQAGSVALPPTASRRHPVTGIAPLKTPRDTRELRGRPSRSRHLTGRSLES